MIACKGEIMIERLIQCIYHPTITDDNGWYLTDVYDPSVNATPIDVVCVKTLEGSEP